MKFFIFLFFLICPSFLSADIREIDFIHGSEDHEDAYVELINRARTEIIIASWKAHRAAPKVYGALKKAQRRNVDIIFIYDREERKGGERTIIQNIQSINIKNLRTHAKFLIIDQKHYIIGSYNALKAEEDEETRDTSLKFSFDNIKDAWPFYMHLKNTYGFREFPANQNRYPPQKKLRDGSSSKLFLLVGVHDHENFFNLALQNHAKTISIYSPFTYEGTLNERLKILQKTPPETTVNFYTREGDMGKIRNALKNFPLKNSAVLPYDGHEKIMIIGDDTLSVGSLNWLSGSPEENDHSNIEVSLILQGHAAKDIISRSYSEHSSSQESDDSPPSSQSSFTKRPRTEDPRLHEESNKARKIG